MAKKTLVVLTGAGISAESGIKTFRDSDGLWENYQIEDVATPQAFARDPELVLNFYNMRRRDVAAAQPNAAHKGLAELQEYFDVRIITQNIDDLHERAGSRNVLHLHGEIFKMRSVNDSSTTYDIISDIQLGHLAPDGGQYRPHIVWFNEEVPMLPVAADIVTKADYFAVIGTSLLVYPAAGLVNYAPYPIPKFIVDIKTPATNGLYNLMAIQKPASQGVSVLKQILLERVERDGL